MAIFSAGRARLLSDGAIKSISHLRCWKRSAKLEQSLTEGSNAPCISRKQMAQERFGSRPPILKQKVERGLGFAPASTPAAAAGGAAPVRCATGFPCFDPAPAG